MDRYEIRLSGAGGQGLITAGIILAEASLYEENLYVTQTQSYGPESRGGASRAEVILSKQLIDYPKVSKPDILVALTQEAFDKYCLDIKENGIIIADERINIEMMKPAIKAEIYSLPILRSAEEKIGKKLTANIIVLGILDSYIDKISTESLGKAIANRVPAKTIEINLKAFKLGKEISPGRSGTYDWQGYQPRREAVVGQHVWQSR